MGRHTQGHMPDFKTKSERVASLSGAALRRELVGAGDVAETRFNWFQSEFIEADLPRWIGGDVGKG